MSSWGIPGWAHRRACQYALTQVTKRLRVVSVGGRQMSVPNPTITLELAINTQNRPQRKIQLLPLHNRTLRQIWRLNSTYPRHPNLERRFCNLVRSIRRCLLRRIGFPHGFRGESFVYDFTDHEGVWDGWVWDGDGPSWYLCRPLLVRVDSIVMGLRVQRVLCESSLPFSFRNAFTLCSGNNPITFNGNIPGTAPQTSADLNFIYIQNSSQAPTVPANKNAAIVNAFYVTNSIHDISYKLVFLFLFYFIPSVDSASDRYRFTEAAYNF